MVAHLLEVEAGHDIRHRAAEHGLDTISNNDEKKTSKSTLVFCNQGSAEWNLKKIVISLEICDLPHLDVGQTRGLGGLHAVNERGAPALVEVEAVRQLVARLRCTKQTGKQSQVPQER